MSKTKAIITTVGTSLFTKCSDEMPKSYDRNLKKEPYDEALFSENSSNSFAPKVKERINDFVKYLNEEGDNACAETASLAKLPSDTKVVLLCTETTLSRMCAEALKQYLGEKVIDLQVIGGLRVDNAKDFETEGLPNLMNAIQELIEKYDCELNISGGYKALIPVLTIMGQLYNLPIHYKYEKSEELITINQYGLGVDWSLIETYATWLKKPNDATGGNLVKMRHFGLIKHDSQELTVLGSILANYIDKHEHPFANSTIGYMVEYKLLEYLRKNPVEGCHNLIHALKSDVPKEGYELDDIDIWIDLGGNKGIAVEVKSVGVKAEKVRSSIVRHLATPKEKGLTIEEYWVVVYTFDEVNDDTLEKLHTQLNNNDNKISCPVQVKYIKLERNEVDGRKNRFNQHEFWRSEITELHSFQP